MTDKKDLTRIEDLSDFLHESDPETESALNERAENDEDISSSEETSPDMSFDSEDFNEEEQSNEEEFIDEFSSSDFEEDATSEPEETEELQDSFLDDGPNFEMSEDTNDDEEPSFELSQNDSEESSFDSVEDESNFEEDTSFDSSEPNFELSEENNSQEDSFEDPIEETEELTPGPIVQEVQKVETAKPEPSVFQEIRDFSKSISYGNIQMGGNPPFSVRVENIKYKEDAEDIKRILREHGALNESNEEILLSSLETGKLLISQVSEYSAIFLAHKLRRFSNSIAVGPSSMLHPTDSYEDDFKGLVNKEHIFQNKVMQNANSKQSNWKLEDIMISTNELKSPYKLGKHLEIVSSHKIIKPHLAQMIEDTTDNSVEYLFETKEIDDSEPESLESSFLGTFEEEQEVKEEAIEKSKEIDISGEDLTDLYSSLAVDLKEKAQKLGANAVVSVQYTLGEFEDGSNGELLYKLTAIGDAVVATMGQD